MKKLIIIVFTFLSFLSFSQEYPRIETDSLGRKIVIMTLSQAQKIDNNFEMLSLLTKQGYQCDSLNMAYIKVIGKQGEQISLLELDVKKLKEQIQDKDKQLVNLQTRLSNSEEINKKCEEQKLNKDDQISLLKKEVRKQKFQKVVGFVVGVVGIVGGMLIIITGH